MIYQPRNVQPSYSSIDANVENELVMELSTNNYVNAYQLLIRRFDNSVLYQGSKVVLDEPIYNGGQLQITIDSNLGLINGQDYKWSVKLFQPTTDMRITYGYVQKTSTTTNIYLQKNINIKANMNLRINNVDRVISAYNVDTGVATVSSAFPSVPAVGVQYDVYSNFIETKPDYLLYARANPTVSITNVPEILDKKYYEFIGFYEQSDNVPLVYFTWNLYLLNSDSSKDLLYTNGKTYSADIRMYYDGFKTGQTYQVELIIETEYGILVSTGMQVFNVFYDTLDYLEQPTASLQMETNAIKIDWMTPTSFFPRSQNNSTYTGSILEGVNNLTQIWIDKSLEIYPGYTVTINNYYSSEVIEYNQYTGLLKVDGFTVMPEVGDVYVVSENTVEGMGNIKILYDNPYRLVNSAELGNNSLIYLNEIAGSPIGSLPTNYSITMQFKPNRNFYFGASGRYNEMVNITEILSTDPYDRGSIRIFAHKYKIVATTPAINADTSLVDFNWVDGTDNTMEYIHLRNGGVDLTTQQYMYFVDYEYMAEVVDFDIETNKVTFGKSLPFVPQTDDIVFMNTTWSAEFYNAIYDTFVLQTSPVVNVVNDYIWMDERMWPEDDENYYWIEGGTEIERISDTWWKLKLTKTQLIIERGGV